MTIQLKSKAVLKPAFAFSKLISLETNPQRNRKEE